MAVSCSKKKPQTPETIVDIEVAKPTVEVEVAKPTIEVEVEKPTVEVDVPEPTVEIEVAEPTVEVEVEEPTVEVDEPIVSIDENGTYTSRDDVALYINTYGKLPSNFITKKEAKKLGWEGGSLEEYAPGKSIGGDYFGNYEELLPEKKGREYHECDIDTKGKKKRGAKRIIYSNDGLIYYTDDHYKTFTLLYGEE
jgi:guanyl-specific ribonuclease Sa